MKVDREDLPKTIDECHALIAELVGELDVKERKLRQIQHQMERLLRWRYGAKRERVDENQLFLFAARLVATNRDIPSAEKPAPPPNASGSAAVTDAGGCRSILSDDE